MLLEKRKVSILRIALITAVIPAFSLLGVAWDDQNLITSIHSISGLFGIAISMVNFIGGFLAHLVYEFNLNGYTWSYWFTAITLNWLALIAFAVIFRQVNLRPRLQRLIGRSYLIAMLIYLTYTVVKNFPSLLESIRFLRDQ